MVRAEVKTVSSGLMASQSTIEAATSGSWWQMISPVIFSGATMVVPRFFQLFVVDAVLSGFEQQNFLFFVDAHVNTVSDTCINNSE